MYVSWNLYKDLENEIMVKKNMTSFGKCFSEFPPSIKQQFPLREKSFSVCISWKLSCFQIYIVMNTSVAFDSAILYLVPIQRYIGCMRSRALRDFFQTWMVGQGGSYQYQNLKSS